MNDPRREKRIEEIKAWLPSPEKSASYIEVGTSIDYGRVPHGEEPERILVFGNMGSYWRLEWVKTGDFVECFSEWMDK